MFELFERAARTGRSRRVSLLLFQYTHTVGFIGRRFMIDIDDPASDHRVVVISVPLAARARRRPLARRARTLTAVRLRGRLLVKVS